MDAEQLALDGMERSTAHAERVCPSWTSAAFKAILEYAANCNEPFMIEDVRKVAYDAGLPRPPAEGAWGTPTKRAAAQGIIQFVGYEKSANATQHGKPCKVWRAA